MSTFRTLISTRSGKKRAIVGVNLAKHRIPYEFFNQDYFIEIPNDYQREALRIFTNLQNRCKKDECKKFYNSIIEDLSFGLEYVK